MLAIPSERPINVVIDPVAILSTQHAMILMPILDYGYDYEYCRTLPSRF